MTYLSTQNVKAVVQCEFNEHCHHQRMVLLGSVHMVFRVLIK